MPNGVSRRTFLAMAAGGLSLVVPEMRAHAATELDRHTKAVGILDDVIREHAADISEPWLLMHGIRAMGKKFRCKDGAAIDHLCRTYLRNTKIGESEYLHMPLADEGHRNAFLAEAVLDSDIEPSFSFPVGDSVHTVADLVEAAKAMFRFQNGYVQPDDLAFSLVVFSYSLEPDQDVWVNAYGESIKLSEVIKFGSKTVEDSSAGFLAAMQKGVFAQKPDQIQRHACGGTHLIYGLANCLRFGHGMPALAKTMQAQFDLLVWRLKSDSGLIDHYYSAVAGQQSPEVARMYYLDAKLKALGHSLEVLNYGRLHNLFSPTAVQEDAIREAHEELYDVVTALGVTGPSKADSKMLYKLIIGDSCHAYRGLTLGSASRT